MELTGGSTVSEERNLGENHVGPQEQALPLDVFYWDHAILTNSRDSRGANEIFRKGVQAMSRDQVVEGHGRLLGSSRKALPFVTLLTAIGAIHLCLFAYYFMATEVREPFWDFFSFVDDYFRYRERGDLLNYLWMAHGLDRIVWVRILTALDIGLFRGITYPFLIFATAALLLVPLLVGIEIGREARSKDLVYGMRWLSIFVVLTMANVVDCSISIETVYPPTLAFAVLSLVLFVGESESQQSAVGLRIGALLAGIASGFGTGAGLAIWPVLTWAAWRAEAGRRWVAATICVGALYIAAYAHGVSLPPSTASLLGGQPQFFAAFHLLRLADYLLGYLGLPWSRAPALALPAHLVGAALLVAGLWAVIWRGCIYPPRGRLERIAVGLILFALGTAAMATLGRADIVPAGSVPVRYSVFVSALHLGLLCLALPWLERQWSMARRRRICQGAVLIAGVLFLVQDVGMGESAAAISQEIRTTIERFLAGKRDPGLTRFVFNDLDQAQRIVDMMKQNGIYVGRK